MWKGKSSLDYTDLFSSNDYEKNDKIILKYFTFKYTKTKKTKKIYYFICGTYRKFEKPNIIHLRKNSSFYYLW